MDDENLIKGVVLKFSTLASLQKKRERQRAFKDSFDDVLLHTQKAQSELDKAYEQRSKRLVERLRNEVLTKLMIDGKKH